MSFNTRLTVYIFILIINGVLYPFIVLHQNFICFDASNKVRYGMHKILHMNTNCLINIFYAPD
jgi:hypothetical protein